MIRPIVYKLLLKIACTLLAVGLWNRYGNTENFFSAGAYICSAFAVIYAALAWFAFLRLDGVRLPRLRFPRGRSKRRAKQSITDLTDHLDTEIDAFEELLDEEKDICSLISSLICCLLLFAITLLFEVI